MQSYRYPFLLIAIMFLVLPDLSGQESHQRIVPITINRADSLFLAGNLGLLAEKYQVEASKAQIIQARLFNNITFNLAQNVYNPETKEWFDISDGGETSASIQKLFLLAGKRNKRIAFADLTYQKEEQHYFDMIRTLKLTLRSDFNNIYYLKRILKVYDREISSLNMMIHVFEKQFSEGLVSRKEVLRLKSSLFSLESEKSGYVSQLITNLSDFNLLLHTADIDYEPKMDSLASPKFQSLRIQSLLDTALRYRYDLLMANADMNLSQLNLKIQKALAIPDITLSAGWDKNGSFVHNYNFIGMQIDLPFSNRNQGNIKSAKLDVESSSILLQSAKEKVKSDVMEAYALALVSDNLYHQFDEKFVGELEGLNEEMKLNYEKRNIGTVEFLDFYDAYKTNIIQLNSLQNQRANAFENLNFSVGLDLTNK